MSYDLRPNNEELGEFDFGAFSWPILLEACGYYFIAIKKGPRWNFVAGVDERMGDTYPKILSNDGFQVTEEEAKVMARIARNFVATQRALPDTEEKDAWPARIRTDFVDRYEKFADWAEKSGGFSIH